MPLLSHSQGVSVQKRAILKHAALPRSGRVTLYFWQVFNCTGPHNKKMGVSMLNLQLPAHVEKKLSDLAANLQNVDS